MTTALEREVRLLVRQGTVDLTAAVESLAIDDLYILRRNELSIRIRSESRGTETEFGLTCKLWDGVYTSEEHSTLSPRTGASLFAALARAHMPRARKVRHVFAPAGGFVWEVDMYASPLDFLLIAECDYSSASHSPDLSTPPRWYRGSDWSADFMEITSDIPFFDLMLSGDTAALRAHVGERFAMARETTMTRSDTT